MSLEEYKHKRSFSKTPEPRGGRSSGSKLLFVIQKHQASHLHYDFRLELKGVLKSWAVPKGPSMDPEIKRLAQLVEDHPFDYKDFEGIIPAGNYGAGTVIIWDQGTYEPQESSGDKKEDEKKLIRDFYSGKISIVMKGKKLKGAFTLVKTPQRGERSWLLFKHDDEHASTKDISARDKSVVSGLTLGEMTKNPAAAKWKSNRNASGKLKSEKAEKKSKTKGSPNEALHEEKTKKTNAASFDEKTWKKFHQRNIEQSETIEVDGRKIELINFEHEYWPGISKLQLVMYYRTMADYILPYLKDRPLGLNIISDWAGEKDPKFLRNMKDNYPSWMKIFTTKRKVKVKGKSEEIDWILCNDLPALFYIVNLGAVDLHPWASRVEHAEEPDYIVIDLDPEDAKEDNRTAAKKEFKKAIKVAITAKKLLDEMELVSFIKTSGKTGLHILIPCRGIGYGDTRKIAESLAELICAGVPRIATTEISVSQRKGKVYVDASQNDYGDRLVAPYCVRAYKQPYVSAPLDWSEVTEKLDRSEFTMLTMEKRVREKGDLFAGLLDKRVAANNSRILVALGSDV